MKSIIICSELNFVDIVVEHFVGLILSVASIRINATGHHGTVEQVLNSSNTIENRLTLDCLVIPIKGINLVCLTFIELIVHDRVDASLVVTDEDSVGRSASGASGSIRIRILLLVESGGDGLLLKSSQLVVQRVEGFLGLHILI